MRGLSEADPGGSEAAGQPTVPVAIELEAECLTKSSGAVETTSATVNLRNTVRDVDRKGDVAVGDLLQSVE